jgi:hypothetical protein
MNFKCHVAYATTLPHLPVSFLISLALLHYKVKVKFSLEQVMKAQRGSRGIALLFL